jgi:hypothetical protein
VDPKKTRVALNDASNDGYLSFGKDDITGQGGYSLTEKGKARVLNGNMSINGKTASQNSAACEEREAAQRSTVCAAREESEDALPSTDVELLAAANRMLTERLVGVAHALRGCGLSALRNIDNNEELQQHVAALSGAYQMALETMANQETMIVALKKSNDAKTDRIADLEAQKESYPIIGYAHVWPDGMQEFESEHEARADIEKSFQQSQGVEYPSYLCAILDKAELKVNWERS